MEKRSSVPELFTTYPITNLLIYNGATMLQYLLGGAGIGYGYGYGSNGLSWGFAMLYLVFAFGQMYILMPLSVCPNCVYYRLKDSRCISGLNLLSRKFARQGEIDNFSQRGQGLLCHNNLYMGSFILPILALIPALILNFSWGLLLIELLLIGLMAFRVFVVFMKVACVHCRAMHICPNAQSMGIAGNNSDDDVS